jgi:wobble nucleotide-excising tRNase
VLQRVHTLRNVGAFSNCIAGSVPFGKFTVIYGRNTYGKSTLADVLGSLCRSDPSPIVERASIPGDGAAQHIKLSFAANGENESNGAAVFQGGKWTVGLRNSHILKVYDETFYYSHVFAARTFSRDTKVNFSSFVLGEQGVTKARIIADFRKNRSDLAREITKLKRAAFEGINDLEAFVTMKVEEAKEFLHETQEKLRDDYRALSKQKENAAAILARKEPVRIELDTEAIDALRHLNVALESSFEAIHEAAKAAVAQHVVARMGSAHNAESWLRQGLTYIGGNECQFCGQVLSEDARSLLDSYQRCFDESFARHELFVSQQLEASLRAIQQDICTPILLAFEKNEGALRSFPELEERAPFRDIQKFHKALKIDLDAALQAWGNLQEGLVAECAEQAKEKQAAFHRRVTPVATTRAEAALGQLSALIQSYNDNVVHPAAEIIHSFKKTIEPDVLSKRIDEIKSEGKLISRKIMRIEKDGSCVQYQTMTTKQAQLEKKIPLLEAELQKEQSDYIDKFFQGINKNFEAFGSHDFTLEKDLDSRGHVPVYFLKVKYKGAEIKEGRLERLFSESDRRALGLAVFWAGLEALPPDELAKCVLVLDDPVTSFDDHRVSETHRKIVQMLPYVEQIILLSHYREGVSRLLTTYQTAKPIRLVEIVKTSDGSQLRLGDTEQLCRSVHEMKRDEIFHFIERQRDELTAPLRVFLETELSMRFAKQIREHSIASDKLSARIEALRNAGIITNEVAKSLHDWREVLNPEHHVWTASDVEDKRNTAKQFMHFLYHELAPAQ